MLLSESEKGDVNLESNTGPKPNARTLMALFHSIGRPTPRNGMERPRTSDSLSPRGKMCPTSDSSTNQMVFRGVPSNNHSFPVSH